MVVSGLPFFKAQRSKYPAQLQVPVGRCPSSHLLHDCGGHGADEDAGRRRILDEADLGVALTAGAGPARESFDRAVQDLEAEDSRDGERD